ncbi:MAG: virulence factor SrfC family protein, partial [Planctomycetota bacterium]
SDMAWPQAPNSFNERIKLIRSTYSDEAGFHWMQRWTRSGEPFSDLYWVHNSSFAKDGWRGDDARRTQTIRSCLSQELLLQHTNDLERRLEALTGNRPEDVAHLFGRIRQLSDGPGRDGRLLVQLAKKLGEVASAVNAIYIGEGDQDRKDKERELAEQHIRELRRTLAKTAPVAEFLSALAMAPEMVVRAFERAAQDAAGDDEGALGSVGFEEFYKSLCSIFVARFDKELDRDARWIRELSSDPDTKAKLCTRFKQFTGADWFRKPIESAADPIIASYDVSNTNVEALGSVVSAIWNRNMVWLGSMPPAPAGPEHRPPRLRSRFAASERILEHWSAHLAERYQQLSDPRNKTLSANVRLGEIRRAVRQSIGAFLGSEAATVSRGEEWSRAVEEIREMHAKLSEPELAAGA